MRSRLLSLLMVGSMVLGSCTSGDSTGSSLTDVDDQSTTTPASVESTEAAGTDEGGPGVPPLDCRNLLTLDDVFDALGGNDANADFDWGFWSYSKSEVCRNTLASDEAYFVEIAPGSADDFDAGAELNGSVGEPVDDVGEGAIWFGGVGDQGVISVREGTEYGTLHFRVAIGRPDVDEATLQQVAIELANAALPRFPGVVVESPPETKPEPEVVVFEEEPVPDSSHLSLAHNLLAREARGEWTRGEGLVALLRLVAGEVDPSEVLDVPELANRSATFLIQLAKEYLEAGDDEAAKGEIGRLLDLLLLTREDIDRMTGTSSAAGLLVSAVPLAQEETENPCQTLGLEAPCLEVFDLPEREGVTSGKYSLAAVLQEGGWQPRQVEVVTTAILDSAEKFEKLGEMPELTQVLLMPGEGKYWFVDYEADWCAVRFDYGTVPVGYTEDDAKQLFATVLSHCLMDHHLNEQWLSSPQKALWWYAGLAWYLGGYVYPSNNLEHLWSLELAIKELATTLGDRLDTNWVFFEYLHAFQGADGNIAMIASFPAEGDHLAALAAYPNMSELFHDFERALTDADVADVGPGRVPYTPVAWELPLGGPSEVKFTVPPFGVRRIHITVPPGEYACFDTFQFGDQRASWRPGGPGQRASWDNMPPVVLEGETMLVITAVKDGARFDLDVEDVYDNPECEKKEEEPASPPVTFEWCDLCALLSKYFTKP
jgi:hypothetical protein